MKTELEKKLSKTCAIENKYAYTINKTRKGINFMVAFFKETHFYSVDCNGMSFSSKTFDTLEESYSDYTERIDSILNFLSEGELEND